MASEFGVHIKQATDTPPLQAPIAEAQRASGRMRNLVQHEERNAKRSEREEMNADQARY
jgi:hypothetical protein